MDRILVYIAFQQYILLSRDCKFLCIIIVPSLTKYIYTIILFKGVRCPSCQAYISIDLICLTRVLLSTQCSSLLLIVLFLLKIDLYLVSKEYAMDQGFPHIYEVLCNILVQSNALCYTVWPKTELGASDCEG